jgi:heptose I phosphotransferase
MKVILRGPFADHWTKDTAFDHLNELQGTAVRAKEGRRTIRFEFAGGCYYLKHHRGIGWREIIKNWTQFKAPVTGASNEWRAINKLRELGLHTLNPLAYGVRGVNPAQRESFLITEELSNTISLAKYAERWPAEPPPFREKKALIDEVAGIARTIHRHGINHRDLYICHFLLSLQTPKDRPVLHLVDLHRAQCRARVPYRWRVKDMASIYFSAMDIGLTRRDVLRFLRVYFDKPVRMVLAEDRLLLEAVSRRARQLYRRDFKREPAFVI